MTRGRRLALATALVAAGCTEPSEPEPPSPLALHVFGAEIVPCAHGVAVGTGGFAYASSICSNLVARLHRTGSPPTVVVRVDAGPAHVAVSPDGRTIYAAARTGHAVTFIDSDSGSFARVPLPGDREAFNVVVSPDGTRLYVTTTASTLYVIDVAGRRIVDSAAVGARSNGLAFDARARTLYVASTGQAIVVALDVASLRETRRYTLGGTPHRIALSPDGRTLYASNEVTGLDVLDLRSGDVTHVSVGGVAVGLAVRREGDFAYVAMPLITGSGGAATQIGVVKVVDLRARTVHAEIQSGIDPRNVAVADDGTVYVADISGRVFILGAVR